MPLKQPRFIHVQTPFAHKFNGFSVWYHPTDEVDVVEYTTAFCSKVDHFCKATARQICTQAYFDIKSQKCRVVEFPKVLSDLEHKCYGQPMPTSKDDARWEFNRYTWVWKYFL